MKQLTSRSTLVQFNNYAAASLWCDPTSPPIVDTNTLPPALRDPSILMKNPLHLRIRHSAEGRGGSDYNGELHTNIIIQPVHKYQ